MSEYCHDGDWANTPKTFVFYGGQEAAGANSDWTDSLDTDGLAAYAIPVEDGADKLVEGILKRVHIQFAWANAVTLDKIRIYRHAHADNYSQRIFKIWESPDGVSHVSDTEYDYTELDIPFSLVTPETIYATFEWSGAAGNIQGFISVEGERKT